MHLIVFQNGLNGAYFAMNNILNFYNEKLPKEEYINVISHVNDFFKSHDGLNAMGERLVGFVQDQYKLNPSIDKISFVGHSLGGLMIRSCIKKLKDVQFFEKVKPVAYIAIASPHLGIQEAPYWRQVGARYIIGQTGTELLEEDDQKILSRFNTTEYLDSLDLFQHRIIYGNAVRDSAVSFKSACMSSKDFSELVAQPHEKGKIYDLSKEIDPNDTRWIRKAIDFSDALVPHIYIVGRGLLEKNLIVLQDVLQYLK